MVFQCLTRVMDGAPRPRRDEDGDHLVRSSIIGDLRQRRILSLLLDRDRPLTERELGLRLLERERGLTSADATEADLDPIRVDLHHRCLPQLEAVGWIERRPDGVVIDKRPSVEFAALSLPDLRTPEDPAWDAVSTLLVRPYRADVLALLADRGRDTGLPELVTALRERHAASPLPDDDRGLRVSLHHVDLPKLASTGLVAYDPPARTVTPTPRLPTFAARIDLEV
jgi:hypothetical protein